ncbi:hypothetical protein LGV61_13290 [Desulfurispirillum indicum]|uniref:Cytochrome c family protein n=1 Tax=Desulfurispirillum indicum (strain ATCC BAA-1389 / DSM 22839 / S5) TaxID=653733 RepID=E6W6I7_DESIS|nr:hypothetical protein [Desulfurispirillum indicum]ADU67322.1 hypothetical protein Selin_2611 [Desulfurispirillum indicum S5]UCZ56684.1 hypothetical protein LGV61_13290 [Desulfurispirillum indicum]
MKKFLLVSMVALFFTIPSFAFDLSGWENGNVARGQWAWFTGQARDCKDPIPVPGTHTRAEWQQMLTSDKGKLPCGGSGLNQRIIGHVYKFLYEHASDSDNPMNQKPESCG